LRQVAALVVGLALFGCKSKVEPAKVSYAEQFSNATSVLITLNDSSGKRVQLEAKPEWAIRIGEVLDEWAANPPTCNCDTSWIGSRAIVKLRGSYETDLHLGLYDSAYIGLASPEEKPELGLNFHEHADLDKILFEVLPKDLAERPELFHDVPANVREINERSKS
jgi:hypothetical protein